MAPNLNENVVNRLGQLVEQGNRIAFATEPGQSADDGEIGAIAGWAGAIKNLIEIIVPANNAYRELIGEMLHWLRNSNYRDVDRVRQILSLIDHLAVDIDLGLVARIEDRVSAQTFDDFLDHADEYVILNRHKEAGVIAGVVFEDTVKRIAVNAGATETSGKVDQIISFLVSKGLLTNIVAKRARAAAAVRSSSTHADWDAYTLEDVKAAITITRELISAHLDK